jgi:hypothetical protein
MVPAKRGDKTIKAKDPFDSLMNNSHSDIGIENIARNRSQPRDRNP